MRESSTDCIRVENWQVDYLDGRKPRHVKTPHSWNLEKSVSEEGPVRYKAVVEKPEGPAWLLFHGVSYFAKVFVNDELVKEHKGIWDAFSAPLPSHGGTVIIEVEVVKNGGPTFPVPSVLSGLIPYIFQTFGGIYREVEICLQEDDPVTELDSLGKCRLTFKGAHLELDGQPFFMRGVVHHGWYPELGRPSPSLDQMKREVHAYRRLGFNTIKFHQWLPPHAYFSVLEDAGMAASVELPLGFLDLDSTDESEALAEAERIIRQYRSHSAIIGWAAGSTDLYRTHPEFCKRLFDLLQGLTSCPLVGIPSFGVNPLDGAVPELSSFDPLVVDSELCFLPEYLKGLERPASANKPAILGDFGAFDHHRDLARLQDIHPYWASVLPEYNAPGVRVRNDLASVLGTSPYAHEPRQSEHLKVLESSRRKGAFMREMMVRGARGMAGLSGYIMNSCRDNPVAASGVLDDWGTPRIHPSETLKWNGPASLYLKRPRRAYQSKSSPRLGWADPRCTFVGRQEIVISIHSESAFEASGLWRLSQNGKIVAQDRIPAASVLACEPQDIAAIVCNFDSPGQYSLEIELGPAKMTTMIEALADSPLDQPITLWIEPSASWMCREADRFGIKVRTFSGDKLPDKGLLVLSDVGTKPMPFWRECAFISPDSLLSDIGLEDNFPRLLAMTPDSAIDEDWLQKRAGDRSITRHMTRLDTRTYEESPLLVQVGSGLFVTTLRPYGGLGTCPPALHLSPAGLQLLRDLSARVE